jgi:hypothetical protein
MPHSPVTPYRIFIARHTTVVRRRVWCETLPYDELARAPLAAQLQRQRIDLLLAVRPWQLAEIGDVVRRLQAAGVFVALWPMLADADGRWASTATHVRFVAFTDELLARVPFADEVVIDLEPPIDVLARWKAGRPTWRPAPHPYQLARGALSSAVDRWRAAHRITTAILPFLALELRGQWLQRILGTPASGLIVDRHSMMAYTSLFEGWSRGLVDRRRAEALLVACARLARRRFGDRAAVSLGTVGPGAFGDEPSYRTAGELARDVALARGAGIDELSLFELGGIVRRPPTEPWLEALCS